MGLKRRDLANDVFSLLEHIFSSATSQVHSVIYFRKIQKFRMVNSLLEHILSSVTSQVHIFHVIYFRKVQKFSK